MAKTKNPKKKNRPSPEPTKRSAWALQPEGPSYLGTYGIHNPWVLWLLRRAPEQATERLQQRYPGRRPRCPKPDCRRALTLIARNVWVCRNIEKHPDEQPVEVSPGSLMERNRLYDDDGVPVDALAMMHQIVDVVYDRGKWRARAVIA